MSALRKRLIVLLLVVTAALFERTVSAQSMSQDTGGAPLSLGIAQARQDVEDAEHTWARARVKVDKDTFERMLAPGFYAQLPTKRLSRAEFIDRISKQSAQRKLTRFDNRILTVQQDGDSWVAIVEEKLEYELTDAAGKKTTEYNLAVTRDGAKHFGDQWKFLFSEVVGLESWEGERPPIKEW